MTIVLSGRDLTVMQVVAVARLGEAVALAPAARRAVRQARAVVQEVLPTRVSAELASSVRAGGIEDRATNDLRALDGHSKLGLGTGRADQLARELAGDKIS